MPDDPRESVKNLTQFDWSNYTIEVGSGRKSRKWGVPYSLLCRSSEFFKTATKQEWMKDQKFKVVLPDDIPEIFELYIHWLYGGKLLVKNPKDELSDELERLVECYLFGEKIQDKEFQNIVMNGLLAFIAQTEVTHVRKSLVEFHADKIYENTTSSSPIRALLVDLVVHRGAKDWIVASRNPDFKSEMAEKLLEIRKLPYRCPVKLENAKEYHLK